MVQDHSSSRSLVHVQQLGRSSAIVRMRRSASVSTPTQRSGDSSGARRTLQLHQCPASLPRPSTCSASAPVRDLYMHSSSGDPAFSSEGA